MASLLADFGERIQPMVFPLDEYVPFSARSHEHSLPKMGRDGDLDHLLKLMCVWVQSTDSLSGRVLAQDVPERIGYC